MGLFLWLYICAGFCNHIIVCLWGHEILRGILTCIWIAANCVGPPLKKYWDVSPPTDFSTSDRTRATITGCRDTEYRCLYLAAGEVPAPVSQSDAPTAVSFLPLQGCSPPALLQRQCLHGKSTTAVWQCSGNPVLHKQKMVVTAVCTTAHSTTNTFLPQCCRVGKAALEQLCC